MDAQIEEIKSKTDIVALISSYMKLTRAGRNYKGLCPFHSERTPSFTVSAERGTFRCFGCGEHGDAISFIEKYENVSFRDALEQLAKRAGVELKKLSSSDLKHQQARQRLYDLLNLSAEFYHYILKDHQLGREGREYVKTRDISSEILTKYKLGYAPNSWHSLTQFLTKKGFSSQELAAAGMSSQSSGRTYDRYRGRLMFPVYDAMGRVVGFSGRSLTNDSKTPKYLNNSESELFHKGKLLYGLIQAKEGLRTTDRIILVEGNIDVLSSAQAGVPEVVAPLGTALTSEQISIIKRFTQNIYVAFDQDKAGVEAVRRSIELLKRAELNIKIVELIEGSDPDECIKRNPDNWRKSIDQAKDVFDYYLGWANKTFDLATEDGKIRASQELVPLIAATESSVAQAFLVQKTAAALGLDEEAIKTEIKQFAKGKSVAPITSAALTPVEPKAKASRRDILSEYIVSQTIAIIAQDAPREPLRTILAKIEPSSLSRHQAIFTHLSKTLAHEGALQLNDIAQALPAADLAEFDRLNLTGTDTITQSIDEQLQDLRQAIRELQRLDIKSQLNTLSRSLKQAEMLNQSEVQELQHKFMTLSQKLVKLQAE